MPRTDEEQEQLEEAVKSVERLHVFDPETLPRKNELGATLAMDAAVEPARNLVQLWTMLPARVLEELPPTHVVKILNRAQHDYNVLHEILHYKSTEGQEKRDQLVATLESLRSSTFDQIWTYASFATRSAADFSTLEQDARTTLQDVKDKSAALVSDFEEKQSKVEGILEEVRRVAEEQGASQEAFHFSRAAEEHEEAAKEWKSRTFKMASALAVVAVAFMVSAFVDDLTPGDGYQAVQLSIGKVVVITILLFLLVWSSKNYRAHRHNVVLNRHRQDALKTYVSLSNAARAPESRDVVLQYAASCIYGDRPSGFTAGQGGGGTERIPMVTELVSRGLGGEAS